MSQYLVNLLYSLLREVVFLLIFYFFARSLHQVFSSVPTFIFALQLVALSHLFLCVISPSKAMSLPYIPITL